MVYCSVKGLPTVGGDGKTEMFTSGDRPGIIIIIIIIIIISTVIVVLYHISTITETVRVVIRRPLLHNFRVARLYETAFNVRL